MSKLITVAINEEVFADWYNAEPQQRRFGNSDAHAVFDAVINGDFGAVLKPGKYEVNENFVKEIT